MFFKFDNNAHIVADPWKIKFLLEHKGKTFLHFDGDSVLELDMDLESAKIFIKEKRMESLDTISSFLIERIKAALE